MSIKYIADGITKDGERVVLWRVGSNPYNLEVVGKSQTQYRTLKAAINDLRRLAPSIKYYDFA